MERKNTVLLTVIAIATLLVAVVGATFAYFTATNNATGDAEGTQNAKTAKLTDITFTKSQITGTENKIYPGTMNYIGASFAAKVNANDSGDEYKYEISYTLTGNVTLSEEFDYPVKWRLYETETEVNPVITCPTSPTAKPDSDNPNEIQYTLECTEDTKTFSSSNLVASGVINKSGDDCTASGEGKGKDQKACGTSAAVSYDGTVEVSSTELNRYYYLVVEYPNAETGQNNDMNKTITYAITDIAVTKTEAVSN